MSGLSRRSLKIPAPRIGSAVLAAAFAVLFPRCGSAQNSLTLVWQQSEALPANQQFLAAVGVSNTSNLPSWVNKVVVSGNAVYAAGQQGWEAYWGAQGSFRIEKRSQSDGSLLWTWAQPVSLLIAWQTGIAVDTTGVYLVDATANVMKLSLSNGTLLWKNSLGPCPDGCWGYDVAVSSQSLYVAWAGNNAAWLSEADPQTGAVRHSAQTSVNFLTHLAVDGTGVYLGGYSSGGYSAPLIEKRKLGGNLGLLWQKTPAISNVISLASNGTFLYAGDLQGLAVEKRSVNDGALVSSLKGYFLPVGNPFSSNGAYLIKNGSSLSQWATPISSAALLAPDDSVLSNSPLPAGGYMSLAVDGTSLYFGGQAPDKASINYVGASGDWALWKFQGAGSCVDIGLRVMEPGAAAPAKICAQGPSGVTSPLRIAQTDQSGNVKTYGIVLVDPSDPNATGIRINIAPSGSPPVIKALRRF